jgi:hypothetical protein
VSRNIDASLTDVYSALGFRPLLLAQLTFRTATRYVWSGVGSLVWGGNTYLGLGSLASVGSVQESTEIKADGTSVSLSGIDPVYLAEAMGDIQQGQPAKIWTAALDDSGAVIMPYLYFSGVIDKPQVVVSGETATIALALESKMINHGRASQRKYTAADQHAFGYPDDLGFNWVEALNDASFKWGVA